MTTNAARVRVDHPADISFVLLLDDASAFPSAGGKVRVNGQVIEYARVDKAAACLALVDSLEVPADAGTIVELVA